MSASPAVLNLLAAARISLDASAQECMVFHQRTQSNPSPALNALHSNPAYRAATPRERDGLDALLQLRSDASSLMNRSRTPLGLSSRGKQGASRFASAPTPAPRSLPLPQRVVGGGESLAQQPLGNAATSSSNSRGRAPPTAPAAASAGAGGFVTPASRVANGLVPSPTNPSMGFSAPQLLHGPGRLSASSAASSGFPSSFTTHSDLSFSDLQCSIPIPLLSTPRLPFAPPRTPGHLAHVATCSSSGGGSPPPAAATSASPTAAPPQASVSSTPLGLRRERGSMLPPHSRGSKPISATAPFSFANRSSRARQAFKPAHGSGARHGRSLSLGPVPAPRSSAAPPPAAPAAQPWPLSSSIPHQRTSASVSPPSSASSRNDDDVFKPPTRVIGRRARHHRRGRHASVAVKRQKRRRSSLSPSGSSGGGSSSSFPPRRARGKAAACAAGRGRRVQVVPAMLRLPGSASSAGRPRVSSAAVAPPAVSVTLAQQGPLPPLVLPPPSSLGTRTSPKADYVNNSSPLAAQRESAILRPGGFAHAGSDDETDSLSLQE